MSSENEMANEFLRNVKNVFEFIAKFGDGESFEPAKAVKYPSKYLPGTDERVAEMRRRAECGEPIFCDEDRNQFSDDLS